MIPSENTTTRWGAVCDQKHCVSPEPLARLYTRDVLIVIGLIGCECESGVSLKGYRPHTLYCDGTVTGSDPELLLHVFGCCVISAHMLIANGDSDFLTVVCSVFYIIWTIFTAGILNANVSRPPALTERLKAPFPFIKALKSPVFLPVTDNSSS